VGRWDQNGSLGDWWGGGLHSTSSGQGLEAGCCKCSDEPLGSCAIELIISHLKCVLSRTVWYNLASIDISQAQSTLL
jgi:hypothetical protein